IRSRAIGNETFDHDAGITRALFNVHPADECAMAEILVTEICARAFRRRAFLFAELFAMLGRGSSLLDASTSPVSPTVPIALRIVFPLFFPLFFIVLAPADFPKPAQRLAL